MIEGRGSRGPPRAGGEDALPGTAGVPTFRGGQGHPAREKPFRRHRLVLQHGPHQHARPEVRRGRVGQDWHKQRFFFLFFFFLPILFLSSALLSPILHYD